MSDMKFELSRKMVHMLSLVYLLCFILIEYFYSYGWAIGFLSILLIVSFFYEEIRLKQTNYKLEKLFKKATSKLYKFHRVKENTKLSGGIYMLLGIIIALTIFDRRIAFAVILMTIFGDMFAALIGVRFGKTKLLSKSLEGTLAGFIVNVIIGILFIRGPFVMPYEHSWDLLAQLFGGNFVTQFGLFQPNFAIIFLMAFMASFAELYFENIDDNLTVPIFAGIAGSFYYLQLSNESLIALLKIFF